MIQALIFDLDDTLSSERAYAFSGFDAVAAAFADRLGDPTTASHEMRMLFDAEHRRRVFNTILIRRGLPDSDERVSAMIDVYRTHKPVICLYPDAAPALQRLRPRYKLGIITDGPAVMQHAKIDALGLRNYVDEIIATDDLGEGLSKPNPQAFERIADRLGVQPATCVYVADNPTKDFAGPNALGWRTIQVTRPDGLYTDRTPCEGGAPNHTIESLDRLDALLQ